MLGYDAPRWHAVLNDLPAALLTVAVLFDLAAAARKRESLSWAAIWTLWAGVIGGWAAVVAGELAEAIDHGEAIHELMERHEQMAIITMSVFTVILIWKMARRFQMPPQELALTRALSIVGIVALVWTGFLGGKLVFEHAAGIPTQILQAEVQDRATGHVHEEGEEHEHGMATESVKPADSAKAAPTHTHPPGTAPHQH
jgi:uncharacterized membrane protein